MRLVIIDREKKKEKKKEGASAKARKERNLYEEKFAELNESWVKARKDILSPNISNIILKHQD